MNDTINALKAREEELKGLPEKIVALISKNVNRKIKRLRTNVEEIEEENKEMLVDLLTELLERDEELVEKTSTKWIANLNKAIHEKLCAQRMKSHYKPELKKKSIDVSRKIFNSKIDDLKERIVKGKNGHENTKELLRIGQSREANREHADLAIFASPHCVFNITATTKQNLGLTKREHTDMKIGFKRNSTQLTSRYD